MQEYLISLLLSVLRLLDELGGSINQQPPSPYLEVSGRRRGWPNNDAREEFESNGSYLGCNVTATRFQMGGDRAFLAMPRNKSGVPFSLGVVPLERDNHQPNISAFPSWESNELGNCGAIQSAVDVKLDSVGQLWVLDNGLANSSWYKPSQRCPPKLVSINVKTGKVIGTKDLSRLVFDDSKLTNLFVDLAPNGEEFVYISDAPYRSLIVFNVMFWSGRRVDLSEKLPPSSGQPILNMVLVGKNATESHLFFTYPGADELFSINADYLRKKEASGKLVKVGSVDREIVFLSSRYPSEIFFNYKGESNVYKWNINTDLNPQNFHLEKEGVESTLPTEVVSASDGKMWVMWNDFFEHNSNECSEQIINLL